MIFAIVWTVFSLFFVGFGLRQVWSEGRLEGWNEVPCVIERFEITASENEEPPFRPDVVFRYQQEGEERLGHRLWREKEGERDYEDLAALRHQMLAAKEMTCRVNPEDAGDAVLQMDRAGFWAGVGFAIFGSGFVLVGVGLLVAFLKRDKAETGAKALSSAARGKVDKAKGGGIGCGFFGVFALAGFAVLFGFVVPKALSYFKMKSWVETPAEVVWSRVESHAGDDGTTYSVDIFYKYDFAGEEYRSNRWDVVGGSSSGRSGKQEVVDAHPPGHGFTCYVNPDKPWQAVVMRDVGWWGLFALFPLPFIAIGVGGMWRSLVHKAENEKTMTELRQAPGNRLRQDFRKAPEVLDGRRRRVASFIGTLVFALFWNGIVSVFVVVAWKGWQKGDPEWFMMLFMIPFVLIGIVMLLAVPYQLLAIFSPIHAVSWNDVTPSPGQPLRVSWQRIGGGGRPRKFSLWLVGQEEATYRRGTRTSTATSVFHEQLLFETENPQMMAKGTCDLAIPADGVPSFHGEHNKVRWFLRLVADVPWRPDVADEHELEVGTGI